LPVAVTLDPHRNVKFDHAA